MNQPKMNLPEVNPPEVNPPGMKRPEVEVADSRFPDMAAASAEQRHELICKMKVVNTKAARQCQHIKSNGEFCGSPSLRGRNYCYFHLTHIGRRLRAERQFQQSQVSVQRQDANLGHQHQQHANPSASSGQALGRQPANLGDVGGALELPALEDNNSIQIALMQVIDAILHNRLDNKRAGLVLYALQTASSNLANGAHFEQMRGATVAGRYDHFEQDFELGEDAPELRVDEAAEEGVDLAKVAQIEEQAAAYAEMDAAEAEADANRTPTEEDGEEPLRASYPCGLTSQFFCLINGPLGRTQAGVPEPTELLQRDAPSQRIELVPHPCDARPRKTHHPYGRKRKLRRRIQRGARPRIPTAHVLNLLIPGTNRLHRESKASGWNQGLCAGR